MTRFIRSALAAAMLAASVTAAPVATASIPIDPGERAVAFATCLGRYAAAVDVARRSGTQDHAARERHDLFRDLLDAVQPAAQGHGLRSSDILSYRISAKRAQARLLTMARSGTDWRRAQTAANVARRQIAMCDALV